MSLHLLLTIIGFGGGFAVLVAYGATALGKIEPTSRVCHALNGGGSAALVCSGLAAGAWPSVGVNGIWAVISLLSLAAATRARRPKRREVTFEPPTAELATVA